MNTNTSYSDAAVAAIIEQLEYITDWELQQRYEQMLDECCDIVRIGTLEYAASDVLRAVDPTAYRCGFADFVSAELGETIVEVNGRYYDVREADAIAEEIADREYNAEPEINPER